MVKNIFKNLKEKMGIRNEDMRHFCERNKNKKTTKEFL